MNVQEWPIADVTPYENNPRQNAHAVAKVRESLREFGWRQPIVVDRNGVVVVGHTRLLAARELGWQTVPVHQADDLSESEARAYRLADNRTADEATWDEDKLINELMALQQDGFELALTGFDDDELANFLQPESQADPDDIPDIDESVPPITQFGDVIVLGRHRLVCGDMTERTVIETAMHGQRAALVFTSAPYALGVEYDSYEDTMQNLRLLLSALAGSWKGYVREGGYCLVNFMDVVAARNIAETDEPCEYPMALEYWPIFRGNDWLLHSRRVWQKPAGAVNSPWTAITNRAASDWEHLWTWKRPGRGLNERRDFSDRGIWEFEGTRPEIGRGTHPAAFPTHFPKRAIEIYTDRGDVVVDPFVGSGSTLMACELTGRSGVGVELSPRYCDVIVKRWENFTGQQAQR